MGLLLCSSISTRRIRTRLSTIYLGEETLNSVTHVLYTSMLRHSGPAVSVSNSCPTKGRILSQFEGGGWGGGRFGQGNIFPPTNNAVHDIEFIERDFFTLL